MNTPHGLSFEKSRQPPQKKIKMAASFQDGRHFGPEILLLP